MISVDGSLVLAALIIPFTLAAVFLTAPRWFFRSVGKHALWRLRDDVVVSTARGDLSPEHPAVAELLARIEWALGETHSFDLMHVWVWNRARASLSAEIQKKLLIVPGLGGLAPEQAKLVEGFRMRYNRVSIGSMLLSSWVGLAMMLRFGAPAAIHLIRSRPRRNSVARAVRLTTDKVAAETRIGHLAREYVTAHGPKPAGLLT